MYDNEESVCGIIYNSTPFYFQKNLQGDIIAILDGDAQTVATYSYDAWGVCTVTSDTSGVSIATVNPYRYRSYYYDQEIGLYYLQSRYYDAVVGRFINADESVFLLITESNLHCNLFTYCKNNSIFFTDALGYFSIPRGVVAFGVDAVIWSIFSTAAATFSFLTQPIKAICRYAGIAVIKSKMLNLFRGFTNTLINVIIKVSTHLVPIIKKAVGWLFRSWASKLTANKLSETIVGGLISLTSNSFLESVARNITVFLSIGGLVGGFWDWWSDGSLNGWIKLW